MSAHQLLSVEGLMAKFAYSRSAVTVLRRDPTFPRPLRLAPKAADRWDEADVDAWIALRKEASMIEDGETPGVRAAVARLISEGAGLASSGRARRVRRRRSPSGLL